MRDKTYLANASKDSKRIIRRQSKYYEVDCLSNTLYFVGKNKDSRRIVVKEKEKKQIFDECHHSPCGGHAGRDNTIFKIKERYYWPGFYSDTTKMVRLTKVDCTHTVY